MPHRTGKCTNYASCTLAYKNADISTEHEFVCPECGQPLREIAPPGGASGGPGRAVLFGGLGAGLLVLGLGAFFLVKALHRAPSGAGVAESSTPAPVPPPSTPEPATPEPRTPFPTTPKPVATPAVVRTATPAPVTATPRPADEEMPTATAVIDRNPQSEENKNMRAEVLKRIDSMPNLRASERAALYDHVHKAKLMMKVITIPFATGQRALSPRVAEKLCEASHTPDVQKLANMTTVVFVILGFADTNGGADAGLKLSTARADAVTDSLRERCKILNKLQPVGMGASEFFGSDKKEKNRVVEVWAVIP